MESYLNGMYVSFCEARVHVCCSCPTTERIDGLMMLSIFLTLVSSLPDLDTSQR